MEAYYVIGKIVHQLLIDNVDISFDTIKERLIDQFNHLPASSDSSKTARACDNALMIFSMEYSRLTTEGSSLEGKE